MRLRFFFLPIGLIIMIGLTLIVPSKNSIAISTTDLKSSYLQSIHDDCRIFLEGIELFIRRDYPLFWPNIESSTPMDKTEINRYLNDLNHFEALIDALYKEFFSLKPANKNIESIKPADKEMIDLQNQIFQMLAYSYMRIGDFSMAQALMKQGDVNSKSYILKIRDIEGILKNFPLTDNLNRLSLIIDSYLNVLELRLKYFLPADMQTLDAYLKITEYDKQVPFNLTYIDFYGRRFPGIVEDKGSVIHIREIARYFNRLTYNNIFKDEISAPNVPEHTISYEFPILKGNCTLVLNDDNHVVLDFAESSVLTIERLCHFKGFVRTDFRKLKEEEKQNLKTENVIDKTLTLEMVDTQTQLAGTVNEPAQHVYRPGDKVRYGLYRLYEKENFMGIVELVPSVVGERIEKKDTDKSITRIKVFEHELLFYQDTLDLVKRNQNTYGVVANAVSPFAIQPETAPGDETEQITPAQPDSAPKTEHRINLFRGCSAKP